MKFKFTAYVAIICTCFCKAQSLPVNIHRAIIWQGFHHQWTYNHRINCIGDYVELYIDTSNSPRSTHLSASGSGPDITTYDSYYTLVESDDIVFLPADQSIILSGSSKKMRQNKAQFSVPFSGPADYM